MCVSIWANLANRNVAECAALYKPPSPMAAVAARLSGRWRYAQFHLVLWGSCGEKGQVALMDYSRTQSACQISNASSCLFRTHYFYDNHLEAAAGAQEGPGASPLWPDWAGFTVNKIHFQTISDYYFRSSCADVNHAVHCKKLRCHIAEV